MARASGRGAKKSNGAAANDDNFDQDGPDGPAKQRGGEGDNSKRNYAFLKEGIEAIEELDRKKKAIMDEAKKRCEPLSGEQKQVKKALAEASFPVAETNAVLRQRRYQRKADDAEITKNFDDEQKDTFQELKDGLGPFADTALGEAVLSRFKASAPAASAPLH